MQLNELRGWRPLNDRQAAYGWLVIGIVWVQA